MCSILRPDKNSTDGNLFLGSKVHMHSFSNSKEKIFQLTSPLTETFFEVLKIQYLHCLSYDGILEGIYQVYIKMIAHIHTRPCSKNSQSREAGPRLQGSCNNLISLRYLGERGIDCIFQIQVTPLTISKLLISEHASFNQKRGNEHFAIFEVLGSLER